MARKITMMSTLIMLIFLSVFLYSGLEKVKAADTEDTIMFPIDGILCHQQAGELFDEINEERAKRGIHELIWDSGYEKIAKIRSIETSLYFSHLLPSAEETLNIGVGKYNRSIVTECLTCGSLDAGRAFQNWMEEPGHRSSILGEWKYAACGIFGIMRPNGWKIEYYFVFIAGFDPISGNENRETGTERVSGYPVVLAHPEERITGISLDGIVNASGVYVDCYYRDTVTVLATLKIRSVSPAGVHINRIPVTPETFLIQSMDTRWATVSGLNMTALAAGDAEISISLREKPSINRVIRIEVQKRHASWDWVRQVNSSFPGGRLPQAADFSVKDDLGNVLLDGRDYDMACHPESSSGYVEVIFSFKGNYKGTIRNMVAVSDSEQNGGTTPPSSDDPGHGGGSSGTEGGNNYMGENSRLTVPSADSQNRETHETGASSPNQAVIRGNIKAFQNSKVMTSTSSKKSAEERADETAVRSDLKKPKLRSVKCSRKGILKISWKKDKKMLRKVDGYEVQISPDSRFDKEVMTVLAKKKATGTKIKIKGKGRKLLYIRIRYYSSVGVSAWSRTKRIRIKV